MRRPLLGGIVDQRPNAILHREVFVEVAALWKDAYLEAGHREEQVRVIPAVDAGEGVVPVDRRDRSRQPILQVPEHCTAEVDVVPHQPHPRVTWPAFLVAVSDDILEVRVGLLGQEALDEVSGLVRGEAEEDPDPINVS